MVKNCKNINLIYQEKKKYLCTQVAFNRRVKQLKAHCILTTNLRIVWCLSKRNRETLKLTKNE